MRGRPGLERMVVSWVLLGALGFAAVPSASAVGKLRVLEPKFLQTRHVPPETSVPVPRSNVEEGLDVAVLFSALVLASHFAVGRGRSRRGMVLLTVFCLLYFGFYRQGCVCPVGSVQNIAAAVADPCYGVPWTVIAFFALPLLFALGFGRTFCAAVCPLGAIQEVVVVRPVRLPLWVRESLDLLRHVYLGVAVTLAATGAGFLICQLDPFVAFFRMGGSFSMLLFGAALLILGMFVGRPYCRFLCPYGVLLGWCSALARRHAAVTPDECIHCRLCEDACPFDAIAPPSPARPAEPRRDGVRRLAWTLALLPVLGAAGGWVGSRAAVPLSYLHKRVALAERVCAEEAGIAQGTTLDSDTFYRSKGSAAELHASALDLRRNFVAAGWILGGYVGIVFGSRLVRLCLIRRRDDYEPDRLACVSCARCFLSCPRERVRLADGGTAESGV